MKEAENLSGDEFVEACNKGDIDRVKFLVINGVDIDHIACGGETGLMKAARANNATLVMYLLEAGANTLIGNLSRGNTAFNIACFNGSTEAAEALYEHGIDTRQANDDGALPIHFLVHLPDMLRKHLAVTKGEDVRNIVASCGSTPIISATNCLRGPLFFAQVRPELEERAILSLGLLLKYGADINFKNKFGRTALMSAAQQGLGKMCAFLIHNGAKPEIADFSGKTALDYCENEATKSIISAPGAT